MNFEELEEKVRQRVGDETAPYILSRAPANDPLTTSLCLLVNSDGTYSATRGDLRTITRLVRDEVGNALVFPNEQAACEWAWQVLEPNLGKKPQYTAEQIAAARASGDAQRERYACLVAAQRNGNRSEDPRP